MSWLETHLPSYPVVNVNMDIVSEIVIEFHCVIGPLFFKAYNADFFLGEPQPTSYIYRIASGTQLECHVKRKE